MAVRGQKRLLVDAASPSALVAFSTAGFLFAWLFPPSIYSSYISEPNLMFLDPATLLLFLSCAAAFYAGIRLTQPIRKEAGTQGKIILVARDQILFFGIPLFLSTAFCASFLYVLGGRINVLALLMSAQGESLKELSDQTAGFLTHALIFQTGVIWWAIGRSHDLGLKGPSALFVRIAIGIAVLVEVATCIARVDRTSLMPLLGGLIILWLYTLVRGKNVSIFRIAALGFGGVLGLTAAFMFLSLLRGTLAFRFLVASFMGYTVVSYNRMAAVIHGILHYPYEGRGIYVLFALFRLEAVKNALGLNSMFNWPDRHSYIQGELHAVSASGLSGSYNWAGVFGYLYADIGWFAPLYFLALGAITGWFWVQFKRRSTISLLVYPWLAVNILMWVSTPRAIDDDFLYLVFVGVILSLYEPLMLSRKRVEPETEASPPASLTPAALGGPAI